MTHNFPMCQIHNRDLSQQPPQRCLRSQRLLPLTPKMWQLRSALPTKLVLVLCTKTWAPLRGRPTRVARVALCATLSTSVPRD
jgi:hypothetical protein